MKLFCGARQGQSSARRIPHRQVLWIPPWGSQTDDGFSYTQEEENNSSSSSSFSIGFVVKHPMQGLRIPTSYKEIVREKMYIVCISPSHHQVVVCEFHKFENCCCKNLRLRNLRRRIQRCMWWSFVFWWFLFLYLKMGASLIESFLVLGPHCNNAIGAKNRICSIECKYLHHIFHCDFAKLSERLSYWTLNSFQWNLAASTTPCVTAITYASSNGLIPDQSESTMILVSTWFVATPM